MGVNNWTREQWRAYNRQTGDRHVARQLPPVSQVQALREDLAQEAELAKLEHRTKSRRKAAVDAFRTRELSFIRITRALTFRQTGDDRDGD